MIAENLWITGFLASAVVGLLQQRRINYRAHMLTIGADIVLEAREVKAREPDAYAGYYDEAARELRRVGVGDLVKLLPNVTDHPEVD